MATTPGEHLEKHSCPERRQEEPPEGRWTASNSADGCPGDGVAAAERAEMEEEELLTLPIWPPSPWAREAVIQSLAESLSSPSTLFEKYGPVPLTESAAAACRIEREAFAAVSPPAAATGDDDGGMETLNAYSMEISKRVVDFCQTRRAASSPPIPAPPAESSAAAAAAAEGAPPIKSEVSQA